MKKNEINEKILTKNSFKTPLKEILIVGICAFVFCLIQAVIFGLYSKIGYYLIIPITAICILFVIFITPILKFNEYKKEQLLNLQMKEDLKNNKNIININEDNEKKDK